jgi:hypothetical protein
MLVLDLFYLVWINSLGSRVPEYLSAGFLQASMGVLDYLYERIGETIKYNK